MLQLLVLEVTSFLRECAWRDTIRALMSLGSAGHRSRRLVYYQGVRAREQRLLMVMVFSVLLCFGVTPARAYSLLTHEQLIDLTWNDSIVPLLLSRYPTLTPAQLEEARAYAYGGCVIQDIGYYPFGDKFFSHLTHYVRTGDFVVNLFRNAGNPDELAFAIGALSHYIGDAEGHSLATNLAVPVEFPKLAQEYGPVVSYAEGETQHVRTEFAFDINELSHQRMAPVRYQKHVGLRVPVRQLALAYYQTYGLTRGFSRRGEQHINVGGYRFAVRALIPEVARAITILHGRLEPADPQTQEIAALRKEVAEMGAKNHWDQYKSKPGIGTYCLAGLIFILPKIGSLRMTAVKGPTVNTEAEYVHSVAVSTALLRRTLARFTPPPSRRATAAQAAAADTHSQPPPSHPAPENPGAAVRTVRDPSDPRHPLRNRDLDTGKVVQPGSYSLTDLTYSQLLHLLVREPGRPIPPGIKEDMEEYYANPDLPITTKRNAEKWKQVMADLAILKTMPLNPEPKPYPTYGDDEEDQ